MIQNRALLARTPRHDHALQAIHSGIATARPDTAIEHALAIEGDVVTVEDATYRLDRYDNLFVLGGGNAAGAAAVALEELLGERIDGGLVVTDDPAPTETIDVIEGTHPLPSPANVDGTERVLACARGAGEDDLVVVVLGGGGSALLCAPVEELSLSEYRELTTRLLESGATIDEINAVRKHLSRLKGGQLAHELAPATTAGILFSDVVGNRLDVIASGPISPDESTYDDALSVLDRYDIAPPTTVERVLEDGRDRNRPETPGPDDAVFESVRTHVLADNRTALDAAAEQLAECGYTPAILSGEIEGEAREVGRVHAAIARECAETGEPFDPPVALLSGGETTVTVTGDGSGGPNQEFALAAALVLADSDVVVAAVDTDGIDGATGYAGAVLSGAAIDDDRSAREALDANDALSYLSDRDTAIRTGRTGTNVNDLRILLVGSPADRLSRLTDTE